jgi:hypothetical protein
MSPLTLVAHYGLKRRPQQTAFMDYVRACQRAVNRSALGARFTPYQEAQIHGTLIGLEEVTDRPAAAPGIHYNANLWQRTGQLQAMDLDCTLALARALPPLTLRFGGFQPQDRVIESRGQTAYARSFRIDWRTRKVVIIGWSYEGGAFTDYTKLWAVRRTFAERCHVHHKYEDDSDFFVTIGELTGLDRLDETTLDELYNAGEEVVETVRARLADPRRAIDLPLRAEDLSVVRYTDERLNPASSRAFPVTDPNLNAAALWRVLYH